MDPVELRTRVEALLGPAYMVLYDAMLQMPDKKLKGNMDGPTGRTDHIQFIPDEPFRPFYTKVTTPDKKSSPKTIGEHFRSFSAKYIISCRLEFGTTSFPDYAFVSNAEKVTVTAKLIQLVPRNDLNLLHDPKMDLTKYYKSASDIPMYHPAPGITLPVCSARHVVNHAKKAVVKQMEKEAKETNPQPPKQRKSSTQSPAKTMEQEHSCYILAQEYSLADPFFGLAPNHLPLLIRSTDEQATGSVRDLLGHQYNPLSRSEFERFDSLTPDMVIEHQAIAHLALRLCDTTTAYPDSLNTLPLVQALLLNAGFGVDQPFGNYMKRQATDSYTQDTYNEFLAAFQTDTLAIHETRQLSGSMRLSRLILDKLSVLKSALMSTAVPFKAALELIVNIGSCKQVRYESSLFRQLSPVCVLTNQVIVPGQWAWFFQCPMKCLGSDMAPVTLMFFVSEQLFPHRTPMRDAVTYIKSTGPKSTPPPVETGDYMDLVVVEDDNNVTTAAVPETSEPMDVEKPQAKPRTLTEEQREKKRKQEAERKRKKAEAAATDKVDEPVSKKSKTHPTKEDTDAPPLKKSRKDLAPPHPLSVDGPNWANGTTLKWPGLPVTMVVNDIFRVLAPTCVRSAHDNTTLVTLYRELLALENNSDILFRWGALHMNEFIALMHLLQILTKKGTSVPVENQLGTPSMNRLTKMLAERGITNQEISLARYVTKPETDVRALPGLIQIAHDLVNEEEEPYGGKPMHDFLAATDVKDIQHFNHSFVVLAEDHKKGQQQITFVATAFKALFY